MRDTDSDRYGRVAVPGQAVVELESGTVDVFYAEGTSLGADATLHEPDLDVAIAPVGGGAPLSLEPRSSVIQLDGLGAGAAVSIGAAAVPVARRYTVTASSRDVDGRDRPEVTLGTDPAAAFADGALDLVLSPWAIGYLAFAVLAASGLEAARARWHARRVSGGIGF